VLYGGRYGDPMTHPGPQNLITDVDGLLVGNAEDVSARTGTTVILPNDPVAAAVDVRGGGPGTRETDALDPSCLVDRIHALCLSGGSVFGLDAAGGVVSWMSQRGRGLALDPLPIPVVPSAILYDLANGGDKSWGHLPPYRALGVAACEQAGTEFPLGNVGAGYGASAAGLKGGLGSASTLTEDGIQVGALAAVNPLGPVVMPGTSTFWAWPFEQNNELGGQKPPPVQAGDMELDLPVEGLPGTNTTLVIVATNLDLDRAALGRVASMAHDGIARAVRPVHTAFDGDVVFALSTGLRPLTEDAEAFPGMLSRVGSLAADCAARAIARGVYEAGTLGDLPGYQTAFPDR